MGQKISIAEYANKILSGQYKMPLMTIEEAVAKVGWQYEDHPSCCGSKVEIRSFIGAAYFVQCQTCKRFVLDVTGPSFGNSYVNLVDAEKVDLESDYEHRWIAAVESPEVRS